MKVSNFRVVCKRSLSSISLISSIFVCASYFTSSLQASPKNVSLKLNNVQHIEHKSFLVKHNKYKKKNNYVSDDNDSSDSSSSTNTSDINIFRQNCPGPDVKIYVKAGSLGGDGSKENPYGNLDEAEAATDWTKLVIIPTVNPVEGNIILQDCQSIQGKGPNPVKSANSVVATIQGSPGDRDAIILTGNHMISNIHIKDADRSAINLAPFVAPGVFVGMENVIIKNVLITNANQGDYIDLIACVGILAGFPSGGEAGAIATECLANKDGHLIVKGSRIDGAIGSGIWVNALDFGFDQTGAFNPVPTFRTTTVKNTSIENMRGTSKDKSGIFLPSSIPNSAGILIVISGSTSHQLNVSNVLINNIISEVPPGTPPPSGDFIFAGATAVGIETTIPQINTCAVEGFPPEFCQPGFSSLLATSSVKISNSTVKNINANPAREDEIGLLATISTSGINNAIFDLKNNVFNGARDGLILFAPPDFFAGNTVDVTFENNTVKNTSDGSGIFVAGSGPGHMNVNVLGNTFANIGSNPIEILGSDEFGGVKSIEAIIANNKIKNYGLSSFLRSFPFSAIVNFNSFNSFPSPDFPFAGIIDFIPGNDPTPRNRGGWASFEAKIENNCIKNGPVGLLEFFGDGFVPGANNIMDAGGGPLGSVGNNSFVNMQKDLIQFEAQVFARENYWGGGDAELFGDSEADTSNFLADDPCDDFDSSESSSDDSSS